MSNVTVTIELSAEEAAGLKRFAEKVSHSMAKDVLYGHLTPDIRSDQAYTIINAFQTLDRALVDAGIRSWPWVETGRP